MFKVSAVFSISIGQVVTFFDANKSSFLRSFFNRLDLSGISSM